MRWCVYRRAKKSQSLMRMGCYGTKDEAQKVVREMRANDQYKTHTYRVQREFTR